MTLNASRSQGKIVCTLYQILSHVRLNHRGRKGFAIAYIVSTEWSSARSEKKREEWDFLLTMAQCGLTRSRGVWREFEASQKFD